MPPPEPLREQIEVAIKGRLSAITAGENYWGTPALVTRTLLSVDQYKTFPVLGVMRTSGSQYGGEEDTQEDFEDSHRVAIWGYVKGDLEILAGTRLHRLWEDVRVCLMADRTLGGLVRELLPDGTMDTDDGVLEPLGFFAQTWLAIR